MNNKLILVDDHDNRIGTCEKLEAHANGLLHRAFSIFIFDWSTHKMLIQKRALKKYHSGGLWTNACCSHPRNDVDLSVCIHDRIIEELGFEINFKIVNTNQFDSTIPHDNELYYAGKFKYKADFGQLCENEIDYVFLYSPIHVDFSKLSPNKDEIEEIKWISINELLLMLNNNPELFTAWFKKAFNLVYPILKNQADNINSFK